MKCPYSREQLHLYIDGMLDKQQKQAFEEHLAKCPKCRAELRLLSEIVRAVETEPLLEPEADFTSRVMARLPETSKKRIFSFEPIFWGTGIAAAFVIATWLSLTYGASLLTILQDQISLFTKVSHWVLLALLESVYSKGFVRFFSIGVGLFLSFLIYQIVSLIYDFAGRRFTHLRALKTHLL